MRIPRSAIRRFLTLVVIGAAALQPPLVAQAREREPGDRPANPRGEGSAAPVAGAIVQGLRTPVVRSAVVNLAERAREASKRPAITRPPVRPLIFSELEEEQGEPSAPAAPGTGSFQSQRLFVSSPAPTTSFMGLNDIPMVDSSYIVIPPDVHGGVGLDKILDSHNNNYRVQDKATGATLSTVGTATFWNPVVSDKALLNELTDPRTLYDPINNRWIVEMQTVNSSGHILIGVSQTSDPGGNWYLYDFNTGAVIDFPTVGFNKNWIAVAINRYSAGGTFQRGITLVASYPQARAGTLTTATTFVQGANSHFCSAPCATLSATEDSLFVVTHLSSSGGTFAVDVITGTSTPVYTAGGGLTRPGGGWAQPGGNLLPQAAPVSGSSSCSPPCTIETQDAQVRSEPVYRVDATTGKGFIYYAQTIGLPSSGLARTAVQWTKLTPSLTAAFADGGRIDDPTATSTNGGKWYAYPHLAVNSAGDILIGYSQFSSAQYPSAGYSFHDHTDPAGTTRDPLIYKAGEDYYHKGFGSPRNRWGDFSKAQVDPSDDMTLWVLDEYAKARVNTDDGGTGSNGSRWSTWWASVTPGTASFTITASAGANGTISPNGAVPVASGGSASFTITPNACYHVADVLVDGSSVGAVTSYSFTNVTANHTISASFAITSYSISASAGSGGSITPSGAVSVSCGSNQSFTITSDSGFQIADVLVDGSSVGAVTNYSFNNVTAAHTIAASFSDATPPTVQVTAPAGGAVVLIGDNATLRWSAGDNVGVTAIDLLLSRTGPGGPFDPLTTGIANSGSYDWTVTGPETNDAFLKAVAHDAAGLTASDVSDTAFIIANGGTAAGDRPITEFALSRVSPQPILGAARIHYELPRGVPVELAVFDPQGRRVTVLEQGWREAGVHEVTWSATEAGPGLYFLRLQVPSRTLVQRIVRVR